jgi:hypothetical protein
MSSTASTTTTTIADFAVSHPFWTLRFLLVYLGNPILFVAYFARTSDNTSQDGIRILGRRTFRVSSTRTAPASTSACTWH